MIENPDSPGLTIDYSPDFTFVLSCARAQEYSKVGMPGVKEYFFSVRAKVCHPTGFFEYDANDICFEIGAMEQFVESLTKMRDGRSTHAKLADPGEMVVFGLELKGRRLYWRLDIREFQPANELTTLHASFDVDFDLFVNKLAREMKEFTRSLKAMKLEQV